MKELDNFGERLNKKYGWNIKTRSDKVIHKGGRGGKEKKEISLTDLNAKMPMMKDAEKRNLVKYRTRLGYLRFLRLGRPPR